jgi:drug/metabolite transporter (DMT)-like permease
VVTAIWGSTFPLQKIVLDGVSPFVYNAVRFWIATIIAFAFNRKQNFKYGILIGLLLAAGYITQTWGLTITTASKSGFITSLYIILVPVVSFLFERERLTNNQKIGFLLAFVGSYFLSGGINGFNFGDLLTLICAVSFAFHVVSLTVFSKKVSEKNLLGWQFGAVALSNSVLGINHSWSISLSALGVALFTAIFATFVGIYLQMRYQKVIGSNAAALIFVGEPVFSTLFSMLFLKEYLSLQQWFGAVILLVSLVLASIKRADNHTLNVG